ncbi:Pycsar system effector family protein [Kribbella sp. NPDC059898]|uniref:Pycsar system effector family protein n=1 Tax=Kribbella sp. NPDC059898 TaxID=3346995 RepID=UPI003656791B
MPLQMTTDTAQIPETEGAAVDFGRCWSVYDNEYYKHHLWASHFPTMDEAVAAVTTDTKGVVQIACDAPKCVARRHTAIQAAKVHQREAELESAAKDWTWRLVDGARDEIGKADAKAGLVATLELALVGAASSGALGIDGFLRWVAIAALLVGVLTAAWAVLPRMPRRTRQPESGEEHGVRQNFGAIRSLDGPGLVAQLRSGDELGAASAEAITLAQITHRKYTLIRWAMFAGAAGLVLAVIAAGTGAA